MTLMPSPAVATGLQASGPTTVGATRVRLAHVGRDIDAISTDDDVIGYICSVGPVFVALAGARLDRAEECGQSRLWDKAAEQLLREAGAL